MSFFRYVPLKVIQAEVMNVNVFESFINSAEGRPGKKKGVRLLLVEKPMKLMTQCIGLSRVDCDSDLLHQGVGLGVSESDVI